jgi:hypothetical protein
VRSQRRILDTVKEDTKQSKIVISKEMTNWLLHTGWITPLKNMTLEEMCYQISLGSIQSFAFSITMVLTEQCPYLTRGELNAE